eukprot:gene9544-12172_t
MASMKTVVGTLFHAVAFSFDMLTQLDIALSWLQQFGVHRLLSCSIANLEKPEDDDGAWRLNPFDQSSRNGLQIAEEQGRNDACRVDAACPQRVSSVQELRGVYSLIEVLVITILDQAIMDDDRESQRDQSKSVVSRGDLILDLLDEASSTANMIKANLMALGVYNRSSADYSALLQDPRAFVQAKMPEPPLLEPPTPFTPARKKPSQAPSPGPTPLSSEQYVSPKPLLPSAVKATIVDESADAFSPDGLSGHTSGVSTSGALIADSGLPSAKEQRTPNSKWASRSSGSFPTITNSSSQLGSVVEDIEQTEWSKAREVLEAKEEQEFRTNEEASRHILQEMDYQLGSKMDELLGRGVDAMKLNNQASPWPAEDPLWHPFLGSDNGSGCRDRHAHRGMGLTSREPRSGPDVSQGATTSRGTNVLFGSPSDLVGKSELSQHSFPSYKTTDLINKAIFGRQSHQAASRDQTQFNRQYSDGSSLGSPSSTTSCTQLRHVPRPSALKLVDITGSLGSPGDRTESPKGFTSPRLTRSSYDMLSPGSLRIAKLAKSGSFGPLTDGTSKGVGYQELLHKYSNRLNIPMLTSGDGSFRTQRSFGAHTRSYGAGNGSVKTRQASCITLRVPPSSTSVREPSKSNSNTRNNSTTRAAAPLETHLSIRSLCSIPASARPSPSVSAASKPRSSSHSTTIAGSYGPIQASGFSTRDAA